jgi:hypothetical protein
MGKIEGALSAGGIALGPESKVYVLDQAADTWQSAIDACVADKGDVIVAMNAGAEVSAAVNFNKAGIRVLAMDYGLSPLSGGEYTSIYAAASFTDGPVANITQPCFIQGIAFAGRDTGATFYSGAAALIGGLATALPFGVHLKGCRFPKWGLDNRIGLAIEGSSNCMVDECDFEGAFDSGIYVQGAAGHLRVRKCHFCLATYAITHGAFSDAGVNTQMEYGPGNVTVGATKFLETGGNPGIGMIFGNYFSTAVGAATFDDTVANLLTNGWVCAGNEYQSEDPGPT